MAYVYSTRLLAWSNDATPPAYEVPTGYVVIVRDADITSGGGAIINFQLEIATTCIFWRDSFTDESVGQSAQWRGRQVLMPGEALAFAGDGSTDGSVSGYLLPLIAP